MATPTSVPSATQANGHANLFNRDSASQPLFPTDFQLIPPQYLPGGRKSLPGISIRAFILGIAFGVCSISSLQLAYFGYGMWRIPFFVSALAVFHYLEFDMTARFNPPDGKVSSFLLFNNGSAYTIAHTTAMIETTLRFWWRSHYRPQWLRIPLHLPEIFPTVPSTPAVLLGLLLIVVGQTTRSLAMAHAKTSFNHIVQSIRKTDHVLVTDGVYSFSRHPSYFGFFWWGLGTQVVLGNRFCFFAYTILLWNFFSRRILHEETHLVEFFGQEYLNYKQQVRVWIPFIR